jgi:hypothetical protein
MVHWDNGPAATVPFSVLVKGAGLVRQDSGPAPAHVLNLCRFGACLLSAAFAMPSPAKFHFNY